MKKHVPIWSAYNDDTHAQGKSALQEVIAERKKAGLPTDHESIREALRKQLGESGCYSQVQSDLEFDVENHEGFIEPIGLEAPAYIRVEVFKTIPSVDDAASRTRDTDTNRRISETISRLRKVGPFRKVMLPAENWKFQVAELKRNFPNFDAVIEDIVEPHLALLARSTKQVPRLGSVLIEGAAGIGKTAFIHELKLIFNTSLMFVDMSSQTNGSCLNGSSTFWSNAAPGQLFNCLAWNTPHARATAAPLVVLDEIDKCNAGSRYDPLAPLYTLLEEDTARNFEDQSLPGLVMNASLVRFFATANDSSALPDPLLSRFQHYYIDPPSPLQQRQVLQRIFTGVLSKLDVGFKAVLSEEVIDDAIGMSPRVAKGRLEIAVAKAIATDRDFLDFTTWAATARKFKGTKSKMGFY